MIRRQEESDWERVASIWLDANREAHDFIPDSYWLGHLEEVRTALAQAEVYVFADETRSEILGFIGLQGDYIAGIFVRREGFRLLETGVDPETGEAELLLEWRRDGSGD